MLNIVADEQTIGCSVDKVFAFVSDFRNFSYLMPLQVHDYSAEKDTCQFTITGMGPLNMMIKQRIEPTMIKAISVGNTPISFELKVNLKDINGESTVASLHIEAEVGTMLAILARNPLQHFANVLVQKLKEVCENP
ncbi:MAG: hypothetical protein U1C46_08555 [Bacteroidales bacterium]|nr:hypothetical protein [Bacteroidales bacterium]MDZ4204852.1 hypothetical protein [Bacteroidales bacterium]